MCLVIHWCLFFFVNDLCWSWENLVISCICVIFILHPSVRWLIKNVRITYYHPFNKSVICFSEVNVQTKEYLGYNNTDDQENECNISSHNSVSDSDSENIYQLGIERSISIVPNIAGPDESIYGDFDFMVCKSIERFMFMTTDRSICSCKNQILCHRLKLMSTN